MLHTCNVLKEVFIMFDFLSPPVNLTNFLHRVYLFEITDSFHKYVRQKEITTEKEDLGYSK